MKQNISKKTIIIYLIPIILLSVFSVYSLITMSYMQESIKDLYSENLRIKVELYRRGLVEDMNFDSSELKPYSLEQMEKFKKFAKEGDQG